MRFKAWRKLKWREDFFFFNFYLWLNHDKCEGRKSLEPEHIPVRCWRKDYLYLIHWRHCSGPGLTPSFVLPALIAAYVTGCPCPSAAGGSFSLSLILEALLLMLGSFICSWIHFYILTQSFSVYFEQKLILGKTQIFQVQGGNYKHIRLSFK